MSEWCPSPVAYVGFWKGGGQKLQKIWDEHRSEIEIITLKFRSIFRPKSGEVQKKKRSNFAPFFAQNQVKSKKKGLHSNFVPVFAQYQVISSPKPDAKLAKGGAMPQWPWSNGPPPKYAPVSNQIGRIHVIAKNLRNKSNTLFFFSARLFLVY